MPVATCLQFWTGQVTPATTSLQKKREAKRTKLASARSTAPEDGGGPQQGPGLAEKRLLTIFGKGTTIYA